MPDASALLAFVNQEPGQQRVAQLLRAGAAIGTVNLAEVITRLTERGGSVGQIRSILAPLNLEVVDFGLGVAYRTGTLRGATRHLGLSLGDRACLALAEQLTVPAVTADRAWSSLQLGITV